VLSRVALSGSTTSWFGVGVLRALARPPRVALPSLWGVSVGLQNSVPSLLTLVGSIPRALRSLTHFVLVRLVGVLTRRGSVSQLQLENAVLSHQVKVLRRSVRRPELRDRDRAFLAAASRALSRDRWASFMVTPQTLLRWHRELVRRKWTYPRRGPGRPALDPAIVDLITLWGSETPITLVTSGLGQAARRSDRCESPSSKPRPNPPPPSGANEI